MVVITLGMSALLLLLSYGWYVTWYLWNATRMKERFVAYEVATEGLMRYGIAIAKAHYKRQQADRENLVANMAYTNSLPAWPCAVHGEYEGKIAIEQHGFSYHIHATLTYHEKNLRCMECCLQENGEGQLVIQDWIVVQDDGN
jgi:hypothetical protein